MEITCDYRGSEVLLSSVKLTGRGDLYMPGDVHYVELADEEGLVASQKTVCYFVPVILVRKGNPKNIRDWDDLLQPGIVVVTPSPLSSGSAKWNLLAPYTVKSDGGRDRQAGLDFVSRLVNDHVTTRPGSGREATDVFLQGTGDVLISYENEAINIERQGAAKGQVDIEYVTPPQTFRIDNPVAVVTTSAHLDKATALKNYLYTPEAQTIWAQAGFRPVDPGVAADFATQFPAPQKLWTIADLGGWETVDAALFDKDTGAITTRGASPWLP